MREIKFRGKVVPSAAWRPNDWVVGALEAAPCRTPRIIDENEINGFHHALMVDQSTIGEFTGAHDILGRRIFEGDIIKVYGHSDCLFEVEFRKSAFMLRGYTPERYLYEVLVLGSIRSDDIKIIGNIHDNKE